MKRRESILVLAALAIGTGSPRASAQTAKRDTPARMAILDDAPPAIRARLWVKFRKRLNDLGYIESKNLGVEERSAGGDLERLPALAAELVALKPDVIVAVTTTVALAVKKATSVIPIVAMGPADPVKSGLVASLGRPGGNLTGMSQNQAEIAGKWIDILREIAPRAKSVAYLTDRGNPGEMLVFRELQERAGPLGLHVQAMDGVTRSSVDEAFATIERNRIDALVVATTSSLLGQRKQIVDSAARMRLPAIYARQDYPEVGGLLSYGTDTETLFLRAADYVDRILRGAPPSELPFEMASTFTLVVNLSTARALGLTIPPTLLVVASEVIE